MVGKRGNHIFVICLEVWARLARELVAVLASGWMGYAFHSSKLVRMGEVAWIRLTGFQRLVLGFERSIMVESHYLQ